MKKRSESERAEDCLTALYEKTSNGEIRLFRATPETVIPAICAILKQIPPTERKKVLQSVSLVVDLD